MNMNLVNRIARMGNFTQDELEQIVRLEPWCDFWLDLDFEDKLEPEQEAHIIIPQSNRHYDHAERRKVSLAHDNENHDRMVAKKAEAERIRELRKTMTKQEAREEKEMNSKPSHWDEAMYSSGRLNEFKLSAKERRYEQRMQAAELDAFEESMALRGEAAIITKHINDLKHSISIGEEHLMVYDRRLTYYIDRLHSFNAEDYGSINEAMDTVENITEAIRHNQELLEDTTDAITQLESELYDWEQSLDDINSRIYF